MKEFVIQFEDGSYFGMDSTGYGIKAYRLRHASILTIEELEGLKHFLTRYVGPTAQYVMPNMELPYTVHALSLEC